MQILYVFPTSFKLSLTQNLFNTFYDVTYGKLMNTDEINYKTLRKIQQMERNSPILTDIKSDFYSNLSGYLKSLEDRLGKESASQKQTLLKDELQNTNKIAINIYEQREKKILLAAISKARGGNPDLKNLVDVEKNLFDSILMLMIQLREQLLDRESKADIEKNVENSKSDEMDKENEKQENSNPIVRITQDIPEFIGTNTNKYNLRRGDILSLPEDMSETLSKRGVAKKIRPPHSQM